MTDLLKQSHTCNFEALINSLGGSNGSQVYSPVKKQHYKHRNVERTKGGIDHVSRFIN